MPTLGGVRYDISERGREREGERKQNTVKLLNEFTCCQRADLITLHSVSGELIILIQQSEREGNLNWIWQNTRTE